MSDAERHDALDPSDPVLVLVKHAMPVLVPDVPARRWVLGEPDAVVHGEKSATTARRRFAAAVDGLLDGHPDTNLIVVAHGTVISLFVAARAEVDPFALWRRLTCPSYVVLARPAYGLLDIVERVGNGA
ncbi:MAG: histidine phosphatase family protein [Thermomicrobiales bacterium]